MLAGAAEETCVPVAVLSVSHQKIIEKDTQTATKYLLEISSGISPQALRYSVERVHKKHSELRKSRSRPGKQEELNDWLAEEYRFPTQRISAQQQQSTIDVEHTYSSTVVQNTNSELEKKLAEKSKQLKRSTSEASYYRKKSAKLNVINTSPSRSDHDLDDALGEIDRLKEECLENSEKIRQLEQKLDEKIVPTTNTDSTSMFEPKFRKLIYKLLQEHVPQEHISSVIAACFEYLGKNASHLPSERTIRRMNTERLGLSQLQIGEELECQENTTLYSDETTKFSEKYMGYHISTDEKRYYVLGVRDLATKSSEDTLHCFQGIIADIDERCKTTASNVGKQVLKNIQNTMSDRAATEIKWHQMLENYRKNILPEVVANWDEMEDADRQPVECLANFYCGLHSYVQVAETTQSVFLEIEKNQAAANKPNITTQIVQGGEPGCIRLVRTAAKAFARGADEKNGHHMHFATYLEENTNIMKMKLVPFRGNRFNIIFFNGAYTYHLRKAMTDYLSGLDNPNRLLQSVLSDLQIPENVAGCKALGLINKFITSPFWRLIEDKDVHVADLAVYLPKLLKFLEQASTNVASFMEGSIRPPFESKYPVKKDEVYVDLTTESEYDDICEARLKVILPAIIQLLRQQYHEFLVGGKFSKLKKTTTKSIIPHNKFAERVFAYTDQLLRFKPNIRHLATEAYVMFCLNQTYSWLSAKEEHEQVKLIRQAVKDQPEIYRKYKQREKEIKEKRAKNLEEKRKAAAERKVKQQKERELMVQEILYYGLWQDEHQITAGLENLKSKSDQIMAVKAQLRFRQHILQQPAVDDTTYRFSEKNEDETSGGRRQLSVAELLENLRSLISAALQTNVNNEEMERSSVHIGKRFHHKLTIKDEDDPNDQGAETVFICTVISCVPGYPQWFNLKYDDDDQLYVEQIKPEIENGNMVILA